LPHGHRINTAVFSPDGRRIAVGTTGWTWQMWDARSGRALGMPMWCFALDGVTITPRGQDHIAFTADGRTLRLADARGELWTCSVPQEVRATPERIDSWLQCTTGVELDELGSPRVLAVEDWDKRRHRLRELGGPLAP